MDLSDLCVHMWAYKGELLLSELFNILFWAAYALVSDVGKIDSSVVERILTFLYSMVLPLKNEELVLKTRF